MRRPLSTGTHAGVQHLDEPADLPTNHDGVQYFDEPATLPTNYAGVQQLDEPGQPTNYGRQQLH